MASDLNSEALQRKVEETEKRLVDCAAKGTAHNDIREADASLQKIVEMGDDGIIVFDEDSRIGFANRMASDILGVPKGKIIGSEFIN